MKQVKVINNSLGEDVDYLFQALLLEGLGRAPITFHRAFVDLTGSVLAGLWLSYALYQESAQRSLGHLDIEMTAAECEASTGITRAQQQTCRRTLIAKGILSVEGSQGKRLRFRIYTDRLYALLREQVRPMANQLAKATAPQVIAD